MSTIRDFSTTVSTTTLPARAVEAIRSAAIEQLLEVKMLRKFGLVQKIPEGIKSYVYFKYDAHTAAYDRVQNTDFKYDDAGATQSSTDVLEIAKGFQVTWEADGLDRLATKVAQTKAAVDRVKDREDLKIVSALTTSSALTSTVTAAGTMSGTSADPIKDLAQAKRKVRALTKRDPDVLLIEEVNLEELMSIIGANDWYRLTEDAARSGTLPIFMGLKVISLPSTKLTHGTAIVMNSGATGAFEIGQAHDVKMKIFDDNDSHTTKIQVYERIAPAVVRADAGAKLTGW